MKVADTNDFKQSFIEHFKNNPKIRNVDWGIWLYKPGMPPKIANYDNTLEVVGKGNL